MASNRTLNRLEHIADAVFGRNIDAFEYNGWDIVKRAIVAFASIKQELPVIRNSDESPVGGPYPALSVEIIKIGVYAAAAYNIYNYLAAKF